MVTNTIVCRDVVLSYSTFSEYFITHIDAIKTRLRGLMIQNWNPIVFYLRKLTPVQTHYISTERENLSIVETLK